MPLAVFRKWSEHMKGIFEAFLDILIPEGVANARVLKYKRAEGCSRLQLRVRSARTNLRVTASLASSQRSDRRGTSRCNDRRGTLVYLSIQANQAVYSLQR